MKLKLDDKGSVVLQDGKPVYTHDDGQDRAFDAAGALKAVDTVRGERDAHRDRADAAEAKLKLYGDLTPEAARQAIEKAKNVDALKAGEVEKLVNERLTNAKAEWEASSKSKDEQLTKLTERLVTTEVTSKFASTPALKGTIYEDKRTLAAPVFRTQFKHDKDLNLTVLGWDGKPIYSAADPTKLAGYDEGLAVLVKTHPDAKSMLLAPVPGGTGAQGQKSTQPASGSGDAKSPTEKIASGLANRGQAAA